VYPSTITSIASKKMTCKVIDILHTNFPILSYKMGDLAASFGATSLVPLAGFLSPLEPIAVGECKGQESHA